MENAALKRCILKNVLYAVTIFVAFVLGEIPNFNLFWAKAVPVIPVVVAIAMIESEVSGAVFGFVGGILIDTYAFHIFGVASVTLTVLGTFCGLLAVYLMQSNVSTNIILTLLSAFIYGTVIYYILYGMWNVEGSLVFYIKYTIPMFFATVIWSLPAYFVIRKINLSLGD